MAVLNIDIRNLYLLLYMKMDCLFIIYILLHRVFVAAHGIFSCGMRTLSFGMRVRSSSPTRDRTWFPALGVRSLTHWTTREVSKIDCSYPFFLLVIVLSMV